jgi:hypothetical protein
MLKKLEMQNSKLQSKTKKNKLLVLFVGIIVLVLATNSSLIKKIASVKNIVSGQIPEKNPAFLVKPVSAQEVYPTFKCPCCDKPIDQCTCPMAKERKAFIDGLTSRDISEDEAVMTYVKNYGLESFVDENKQEEFKEKLIAQAPADRPIIAVNSESSDLGNVSQKEGIRTTFFEVKNEGKSNLIIDRLETSCGCTSGSIVYQDKEGPRFAMPGHGINEEIEDWQVSITPGDTAQLKVYYDPSVHPDFRGAVTRIVSVYSNDPIDFEKRVIIELNQVD